MAEVYEFIDGSEKYDVNTLVVDFRFESDVTKEQAIRIIDRIVSSADNDNTTAKMTGHTPTMYAKTPLAIVEAENSQLASATCLNRQHYGNYNKVNY